MQKIDRKKQILTECLALFSKHGYDGVSMRDIAKAVGFRESALYKHYKSKQEILDSIFIEMKTHFEEASKAIKLPEGNDFSTLAMEYKNQGLNELKKQCSSLFLYWLKDHQAVQFRRLLMLEQFRHSEAENILREFLIDGALQYQTALFEKMIDIDYFKEVDSEVLALQFYSPIFLLLCKYDGKPEKEKEALSILERHVDTFDSTYRNNELK
ncbi:TetR/AcrR family transcriptional regulator [Clostridium sp. HCS.1]|uniref:TetR/AcrR family transcriptional regulator n=1 Tax=Clostridium sp. HCS.1 TaxID=3238594 RepID=UPI003A0FD821